MRYTYYYNKPILPDTIQELLDKLQMHSEMDLFFTTNGGSVSTMASLIHALNGHENLNVYLIDSLSSCGTQLLTDYTGRLFLTKNLDLILFHPLQREFTPQEGTLIPLKSQLQKDNDKLIEDLAPFLTEGEIKDLREGKEVYVYRRDFKRFKKPNITVEGLSDNDDENLEEFPPQ